MCTEDEARGKLKSLKITNGEITQIEFVPAGVPDFGLAFPLEPLPEHCRVCVRMSPEGDSNILIEVWMPLTNWNSNFLGTGNGATQAP
ncbi:tannase/feruloyl esterase family alpha/beta hydrolase [Paenibacillus sp. OVF10]|nr:tannase/feruloyl esterase family alpha/beta hydrolase [Paenibacillus sp. OVF10]